MERDELVTRLWRAAVASHGGEAVVAMVKQHYRDGLSIRAVARRHGVSPATAHARIHKLRSHLAEHGILPASWQHRDIFRSADSEHDSQHADDAGELNP